MSLSLPSPCPEESRPVAADGDVGERVEGGRECRAAHSQRRGPCVHEVRSFALDVGVGGIVQPRRFDGAEPDVEPHAELKPRE